MKKTKNLSQSRNRDNAEEGGVAILLRYSFRIARQGVLKKIARGGEGRRTWGKDDEARRVYTKGWRGEGQKGERYKSTEE